MNRETLPIAQRFQQLLDLISSTPFLQKEGLGNEVPFFICPYSPQEAVPMTRMIGQLANKLRENSVDVLLINLYDLAIELLQQRGILERIIDNEPGFSKDQLKETLQNVLDPENHLTPAIDNLMKETDFDVVFLYGVGEVFPYIRSHNVLNNLQTSATGKPTVLFFPGAYTQSQESGSSLDLFGLLKDDKYYRAFNIYHFVGGPPSERNSISSIDSDGPAGHSSEDSIKGGRK
jgi:hypothetical protein